MLAISENNINNVKSIFNYTNKKNIILDMNEKNERGNYPLICAITNNNTEIVKEIIDYAKENNIILEMNENDIANVIFEHNDHTIGKISDINSDIIKLLYVNKIYHRINIKFYGNELSNMFSRIIEIKEVQKPISQKTNIETPTLVIAKQKFIAQNDDELDIDIDEFLIVTDWDYEEGFVYGHKKGNENEKGKFPKVFIKICNKEKKSKYNYFIIYICIYIMNYKFYINKYYYVFYSLIKLYLIFKLKKKNI